ncbi:hypothetical protein AU195_03090 [Mycobacterium sp. IS-1496]|nr:hypothetical protein AU195_03090 [Mycobacterium sp. IS-1496]
MEFAIDSEKIVFHDRPVTDIASPQEWDTVESEVLAGRSNVSNHDSFGNRLQRISLRRVLLLKEPS